MSSSRSCMMCEPSHRAAHHIQISFSSMLFLNSTLSNTCKICNVNTLRHSKHSDHGLSAVILPVHALKPGCDEPGKQHLAAEVSSRQSSCKGFRVFANSCCKALWIGVCFAIDWRVAQLGHRKVNQHLLARSVHLSLQQAWCIEPWCCTRDRFDWQLRCSACLCIVAKALLV